MRDTYQREINYLRISVTDRCNLRCRYCMPETGVELKPAGEILTLEEIARLVGVAAELGVKKIRITGGEPLVRKGLPSLIAQIDEIPGIEEITLTTNGIFLARMAAELKNCGLDRVNISLDTLKPERFRYITRRGELNKVLEGIEQALKNGLTPVKLNVVVTRDFNLDEVVDFARLTTEYPLHVRFIELMPIGQSSGEGLVPSDEVKELISRVYLLQKEQGVPGNGPADYYQIPGAPGSIGLITAMSHNFCEQCNRLRLTADGRLRPCLEKNLEFDVKDLLRAGGSDEEIRQVFLQAVASKPEHHDLGLKGEDQKGTRNMFQIGG